MPAPNSPMPESGSLSVVVPIYNGAATVDLLVERLTAALRADGRRFEIILVNDGSHDDSWNRIEALAQQSDVVRGIDLMRNYGQHNALLCGIRAARHEFVVTMDDDLQHPPEEIPRLLVKAEEGFDVVYGVLARERHGWLRTLASRCTKLVLEHAMEVRSATDSSAFRLFRTVLRDAFAGYQSPYSSIDVLLSWSTTRFGSVAVRHDPRHAGTSGYRLRTLVRHGFNMLTGYSALPLQMATLVGFTSAVVRCRCRRLRRRQLSGPRRRCARLHLSGRDHRDLRWRAAFRARHHRRVSFAHALPGDESPGLHCAGDDH